jgi:hypothetical protein
MCRIVYNHKVSSAAHGGQGFELTVEVCDNPKHDEKFIEMLGKRAIEASKKIRGM